MKPEGFKDQAKKGGYDHKRPIENRVSLPVIACCMSRPLDKVGVGFRMTFPAGLRKTLLRYGGFRIFYG